MTTDTNSSDRDITQSAESLEKIIQSLEMMLDLQGDQGHRESDAFSSLNNRIDNLEQMLSQVLNRCDNGDFQSLGQSTSDDAPDEPSDWSTQKQRILADYGIDDPTNQMLNDPLAHKKVEASNLVTAESAVKKSRVQETNKVSELQLTEEQAKEVEELKTELRGKIRQAEVELSIKQAKLEQQEARIEEKQAQVERQESELSKSKMNIAAEINPGVLGRLKRHLNFFAGRDDRQKESAAAADRSDKFLDSIKPKADAADEPSPESTLAPSDNRAEPSNDASALSPSTEAMPSEPTATLRESEMETTESQTETKPEVKSSVESKVVVPEQTPASETVEVETNNAELAEEMPTEETTVKSDSVAELTPDKPTRSNSSSGSTRSKKRKPTRRRKRRK